LIGKLNWGRLLVSISCESQLCSSFGYDHAVLFGRGRAGLLAVLEEVGGRNVPVIIPSNICVAVPAAIRAAGCKPVLAPVSAMSGLADDARLAAAIEDNQSPHGIVMPTHLYGMWSNYPRTRRSASERGWFLLENDSLAASIDLRQKNTGDALLLSFGSGKTIDAGMSGAVLTNDAGLAKALKRRAKNWPIVSQAVGAAEMNVVLARRYLHALGRAEVGEPLLEVDIAYCQNGFDEGKRDDILEALGRFGQRNGARMSRLKKWQSALAKFAPAIVVPEIPIRTPWRAAFRFESPHLRNAVVSALRTSGIDAGTNYPPLTDFLPKLLEGQTHADAKKWGETVLTLWIDDAYDNERIARAGAIIEDVVSGEGGRGDSSVPISAAQITAR
jgi:dTDP-4-amino-4,6-dideoxygalactose transaminase